VLKNGDRHWPDENSLRPMRQFMPFLFLFGIVAFDSLAAWGRCFSLFR
jgi:hypothetical protein